MENLELYIFATVLGVVAALMTCGTCTTSSNQKLDLIMANIQELRAQVAQLQADLDSEQQQVAEAIAALEQAIIDLQAMVADGGTPEERQALSDALTAISEDLKGTIPDGDTTTTSTTESTTETTTVV